jgi:23S rRNA (adenine2503-C2)-methyltransferase
LASKISLLSLFPIEISDTFTLGPAYRGKQVFSWVQKGIIEFSSMANIPLELRENLIRKASLQTGSITQQITDDDGTKKIIIALDDNIEVEAVLLKDKNNRHTGCISTQAGCAMACAFCRTGKIGLTRNLFAHEIIEQYFHLKSLTEEIDNLVFMGMGEPLANFDNVLKSIQILSHHDGQGMSMRRFTISTCGLIKGIRKLALLPIKPKLAVSLVTANQGQREKLMPVAYKNPLPALRDALVDYQNHTGKRVTLEIVLLKGINDDKTSIAQLIQYIKPLNVMVNLIPWNTVEGINFEPPKPESVNRYKIELEKHNIPTIQRTTRGTGVSGACGQLGRPL